MDFVFAMRVSERKKLQVMRIEILCLVCVCVIRMIRRSLMNLLLLKMSDLPAHNNLNFILKQMPHDTRLSTLNFISYSQLFLD